MEPQDSSLALALQRENLFPLGNFENFPTDLRPIVLSCLQTAADHVIPSDKELSFASRAHPNTEYDRDPEFEIELRYGRAADDFAKAIDPAYTRETLYDNPQTFEFRAQYYMMIRTLSASEVRRGVDLIKSMTERK